MIRPIRGRLSRRSTDVDTQTISPLSWTGRRLSMGLPRRGPVLGAVLVLHGGRVSSQEPASALQPAVLRIAVLAQALRHELGPQGIAVANLRFGVRGWNGGLGSPMADATWALDRIRAELDVPVVIVGHSMGGRTAVRVAGQPGISGVVGLAPWLPPGEPVRQLAGRGLAIVHGTDDRITDPAVSAAFVERARPFTRRVSFESVAGDGHAMLRKPALWNRLAAGHARELLGIDAGHRATS